MPKNTLPIALLQGDKAQDITDYIDALPVNVSGVVKDILGAKGYMLEQPGLTQYGTLTVTPDEHEHVTFDGSAYLSKASDLTGIADGKLGTFVTRIRRSANSDDQLLQNETTAPEHGIDITIPATGYLALYSEDTGGTPVLDATADVAFTTPGEWLNICLSWDAASAPQLYINDVLISMTLATWTDQALDYTGTSWNVYGSSRPFGGDTNFMWFSSTTNIDFSVEANRRLFFDSNGCPVDLGANGQTPTGASPILYLAGDSTTFATNKGTGGGFTLTGSLTDGSSSCP